ncbi:unnamed protein product [Paramecium pentaurelia]|uniref:Uncharacterized protein n=1 Tax=Paramecium pentaurelia TaxID=43138 RepID=A0A8S1SC68_9CILI|nr:unnamed protein product [Paramecium pentaurelia]
MCDTKCECIPLQLIKSLQKKQKISEIDLQGCNVEHLIQLNQIKQDVDKLYLASNRIQNLDYLPLNILYLDISNNSIANVDSLQQLQKLRVLRCGNNLIEQFEIQSAQLEILDISNNYLDKLPNKIQNLVSLSIYANSFKNYENDAKMKYKKLQILDGCIIQQSQETEYIIKLQEQQLAQKFQMNIDYLNKWRQEVFKQLVQNKQYKLLTFDHLKNIKQLIQKNFGQMKYLQMIEKRTKQLQQLQKKLFKCSSKLKREQQQKQHEQQFLIYSLKHLLEEDIQEEKLDILIKKCSEYITKMKQQNLTIQIQMQGIQQENEHLRAQVDHFKQMYNQIKQINLKNEDSTNQDKNKGFVNLYAQIKNLEEEKLKLQFELNSCQERQNVEILHIKAQLEQQIALLSQENQFFKQKFNLQQEEIKIKMDQIQQQYEKQLQLQNKEHQTQCDKIRNDYQQIIDNYVLKDQQKNSDLLKLRDLQNDLELQIRQNRQESDFSQREYSNQIKELQLQIKQQKEKIIDQENLILQLKQDLQKQQEDVIKQIEQANLEQQEIQNQLQKTIFDQSNEIQEQKASKNKLSKQNMDLLKMIEMKDGVIRSLTLEQTKKIETKQFQTTLEQKYQTIPDQKFTTLFNQSEQKVSTLSAQNELERKALQILQDDDY